MDTVKLAFVDFWPEFKPQESLFIKLLQEEFEVIITDATSADYVFFSLWGDAHWYVPDRCVKIFYTGEHLCPDFNSCDYAMAFDWLDYGDRYFRLPHYLLYGDMCQLMERKHSAINHEQLKIEKKHFCSFTVSNNKRCNEIRERMFWALSDYKKVDSGGRWNNNVGGPVADKFEFDKAHKFSICFENISHRGYTTEKLVQAFAARTIPIYWGDPLISNVFNTASFINVADYGNDIEEVVKAVKRIDENDELYLKMLSEPALVNIKYSYEEQKLALRAFLYNIVSQPLENAYRRNRITFYVSAKKRMIEGYYKSVAPALPRRVINKVIGFFKK